MKPTAIIYFILTIAVTSLGCNSSKGKKEDPPVKNNGSPDSLAVAQQEIMSNPYAQVDVSPMDMSYYPPDYPKLKMAHTTSGGPLMRVVYSRPHLGGRHLFHDVLKYGEPWRLGANESSEIEFFREVTIQNKKTRPGRYILYCIPQSQSWTIVLNSNIDSWGLKIDSSLDVARFDVPVQQVQHSIEYFTMVFEKAARGAALVMAWDNLEARLPIQF